MVMSMIKFSNVLSVCLSKNPKICQDNKSKEIKYSHLSSWDHQMFL